MLREVPGFVYGIVSDNNDPLRLGRVKAHVPGYAEPDTGYWCNPFAWPGAGGAGPGGSRYPLPLGAQIIIMFEHGDPDTGAVFAPAMYGHDAQSGQPQGPTSSLVEASVLPGSGAARLDATELSPEAVQTRTVIFENDKFAMFVIHDGDYQEPVNDDFRFVLMHKTPYGEDVSTGITINANDGFPESPTGAVTMSITAQTTLNLKSTGMVNIEGASVIINGRLVSTGTTGTVGSI